MKTSTTNDKMPFKASILFPHDNKNIEIMITPDDKLLYIVRGCNMMAGASIIINIDAIDVLISALKEVKAKATGQPDIKDPVAPNEKIIAQDDYYMMQEILQELVDDAKKKGYEQKATCRHDGTRCDQIEELQKSRDDIMKKDIEFANNRKKFFHLVKIALGINENATEDNCLDMIANLVSKRDENNHDGNENKK